MKDNPLPLTRALIYLLWISLVMKLLDILYNRLKIPEVEMTV